MAELLTYINCINKTRVGDKIIIIKINKTKQNTPTVSGVYIGYIIVCYSALCIITDERQRIKMYFTKQVELTFYEMNRKITNKK